eukprot:gene14880-20011_t
MEDENKRERKQTTFYTAPITVDKPKSVTSGTGKGVSLGDLEYFNKEIEKLKGDNEVLKSLHGLLFNTPGKKGFVKRNLRTFNGFPDDVNQDQKIAKITEKKKVWTVSLLKSVCGILGLEKSGDRSEIILRLVEYLMCPRETKKTKSPSITGKTNGKRKRNSKDDSSKKKKAPSAFMLFSQANRISIKQENPDASFGELSKLVGEAWAKVNEKDKKVILIKL